MRLYDSAWLSSSCTGKEVQGRQVGGAPAGRQVVDHPAHHHPAGRHGRDAPAGHQRRLRGTESLFVLWLEMPNIKK